MKSNGYNPKVKECYFCSGKTFEHHSTATYWKEFDLNFVECNDCGLIFTNPMPSIDIVIEGNRALNIHHVSRGTFSKYRAGKELALYLNSIKKKGLMLDVGCAEGFSLLAVEENSDWKAEGIDIIESVVEFASKRFGVKIHLGTLETLNNAVEKYDFIQMINVIEHVQHPLKFLHNAHKLLKRGGIVYCSTPNGFQDGHVLKTANKRGIKINLLENHFFYYPPETLVNIFKSCGFKIIKAYCRDIKHSLNDFGLMPTFRYSSNTQDFSLNSFKDKTNREFDISDEEIKSFKNDPGLKLWKLKLKSIERKFFHIRMPYYLPIGHQQFISAKKI